MVERRDPLIDTVLDQRFRIDRQLAAGGFGAIYRATDLPSGTEIALKILHPQLARDPSVVARFRREGKTLATLRDPHTITAYELGEAPDGTLYIVMELLHGESLYNRFRTVGPMPWRQVVHIARGVCSSLAEAHAAGIVHRDLKPANIHLENVDGDADFAKVLDFGIAKIVQGNAIDRTELTQAGTMIGTVEYMSPEQMVGGEMTPASDVYTLGVVLYEMIAGRTPFADAQTATAILAAVLTQLPDPLARYADVPPALDRIVARCLEREIDARFPDVGQLADALAKVAGGGARRGLAASPEATTVVPARGMANPGSSDASSRAASRGGSSGAAIDSATDPSIQAALAASRSSPDASVDSSVSLIDATLESSAELSVGDATLDTLGGASSLIPSSGFEQPISTTEATRIDVRYNPSSEPVIDARGRRKPTSAPRPEVLPPPPSTTPVRPPPYVATVAPAVPLPAPASPAKGSQHAIDARAWQPVPDRRGALPMLGLAPASPPSMTGPGPGPGRGAPMPPLPRPLLATPVAVAPSHMPPMPGMPQMAAMPIPPGPPMPPGPPHQRPATYNPRRYDMDAVASRDALVRRIIWISLLVAIAIGLLIATR